MKAIPEHGDIPPHSLLPELSIVLTSTTPGPVVHEPITAEPLTQMDVAVGLAIRLPRAALTGVTNAGSEATKISKPPIASEPEMKTPTVKV